MTSSRNKDSDGDLFDLGSNLDRESKKTGTIKELLAEINQNKPASGKEINLDSLRITLNFIGSITGRGYTSITEEHPLSFLRIVKLLYIENDESGIQLFQYLKAPHQGAKPTMEFRTTGVTPRNEYRVKVVNELLERLCLEIDASKLQQIESSLLTASKLLQCIDIENQEILEGIYELHACDHAAVVRSLNQMTRSIRGYRVLHRQSTAPLDEILYTYIRKLPFLHFVGEYKEIVAAAKIGDAGTHVELAVEEFCVRLGVIRKMAIAPNTFVTSVQDFAGFFDANARDLIQLVKVATGLPTQLRDLAGKLGYASKILAMYTFHQHGKVPLNLETLSVSDCIAALCTVRQQQDAKTNYTPYWHGQESADKQTHIFGQMQKERSIDELWEQDYIPHGINQLLYGRFCQFHAKLAGQQDRHEAILAFQLARLEKYAECLLGYGVDDINAAVRNFNYYSEMQAQLLTHPALQTPFIERMNSWLGTDIS